MFRVFFGPCRRAAVRPAALLLAAGLGLSACVPQPPRFVGPAPGMAPVRGAAPTVPLPAPLPTDAGMAARAERACVQQGRAEGLAVQRVVGTRAVIGPDGQMIGRDVMLQVSRQGRLFDVRCNFTVATDEARIMTL